MINDNYIWDVCDVNYLCHIAFLIHLFMEIKDETSATTDKTCAIMKDLCHNRWWERKVVSQTWKSISKTHFARLARTMMASIRVFKGSLYQRSLLVKLNFFFFHILLNHTALSTDLVLMSLYLIVLFFNCFWNSFRLHPCWRTEVCDESPSW